MAKVRVNSGLSGLNLYTDRKGRLIYYNPLLKKAWQVPKHDEKKFSSFKARFIFSAATLLVLCLVFNDWFHWPIWIAVLLSLAVFIVLEILFVRFLNTLPPVNNFDKTKLTHTYDLTITEKDRSRAILRLILYVVLGVLLVVNAYQMHYDAGMLLLCYGAMIYCLGYAAFLFWQLSRSQKNPDAPVRSKKSR